MDAIKKKMLEDAGYTISDTQEFLGMSDNEMKVIRERQMDKRMLEDYEKAIAPHKLRLVSTKDGSPLRNKVKFSRNAVCPCGSGKKFKNCHQKSM